MLLSCFGVGLWLLCYCLFRVSACDVTEKQTTRQQCMQFIDLVPILAKMFVLFSQYDVSFLNIGLYCHFYCFICVIDLPSIDQSIHKQSPHIIGGADNSGSNCSGQHLYCGENNPID